MALTNRHWPYHSSQPTWPTIGQSRSASERLIAAGWTKDDLAGFWGGNALRVLRQADELKAK